MDSQEQRTREGGCEPTSSESSQRGARTGQVTAIGIKQTVGLLNGPNEQHPAGLADPYEEAPCHPCSPGQGRRHWLQSRHHSAPLGLKEGKPHECSVEGGQGSGVEGDQDCLQSPT